jgi:hypothetical protein
MPWKPSSAFDDAGAAQEKERQTDGACRSILSPGVIAALVQSRRDSGSRHAGPPAWTMA